MMCIRVAEQKTLKTYLMRIIPIWSIIILAIFFFTIFCAIKNAAAGGDVAAVWGEFSNTLKVPGIQDVAKSTSATFFGGHIKVLPDHDEGGMKEPQGGGFKLVESSFGQAVANSVPYPKFEQDVLDRSLKMLYYDKADATGEYLRDKAAFRYKVLLYGLDGNSIRAQFETMAHLWTNDERKRAEAAAKLIKDAIKYNPYNTELRKALLDIYYDIVVADLSTATEKIIEAQKAALGLPGYIPPPGEFLISKEIEQVDAALPLYDKAMKPYFELLKDPMGVDTTRVDSSVFPPNMPFGYYIFKQEVPGRSLYAPLYKDQDGALRDVVNNTIVSDVTSPPKLFAGYKDLVLLFNAERDYARAAAKLAKLYALRGMASDAGRAREAIGDAQQKSYTDGAILNGIFSLNNVDPQSGFVEARANWAQGLAALSGIKGFLDGNANPLGLDKGFLALVQTDLPGNNEASHDSYDYFANLLLPGGEDPGGLLGVAKQKYDNALAQYERVQINKDNIKSELQNHRRQFGDRLRAIVGAEYSKNPAPDDRYNTPEQNEGSEISIQMKSIEVAKLRIRHNQQEIDNLYNQIQNEIDRRGQEAGINNLIRNTYLRYGRMQAELTVVLGAIKAVQVAADEAAKATDNWFTSVGGSIISHGTNAIVQVAAELAKAAVEQQKERLAAQQSADIVYQNDRISAANSEARVKDLLLGMNTLSIESMEAAVVLAQEWGKLEKLLKEKAYLEAQWAEAEEDLSTRYFADPSHRIILNQYIIDADFAFDEAQLWVFIMARALDYKWNTSVVASHLGKTYTANTVFGLRNAKELVDMAIALYNWNKLRPIGIRGGDLFVKFSLREDFLGFRRIDYSGNPLKYPDPVTGLSVDALTAFRSYLKNVAPHVKPVGHLGNFREVVRLEFSTAKPNRDGTFFSPDRWNEKIQWLAAKINAAGSPLTQLSVWLEQSGVGMVRNQVRGQEDPDHPDIIKNEMTSYPTRYWYQEEDPVTHILKWRSKDTFGFTINARVVDDPNVPAVTWQKKEFHEMPPAVSKWILEIPITDSGGQPIIDLDKVEDVEIWFMNYYKARN